MKYTQTMAALTGNPSLRTIGDPVIRNYLDKDFDGKIAQEITFVVVPRRPTQSVDELNALLHGLNGIIQECERTNFYHPERSREIGFGRLKGYELLGKRVGTYTYTVDMCDGPKVTLNGFDWRECQTKHLEIQRSITVLMFPCEAVARRIGELTDGTFANVPMMNVFDVNNLMPKAHEAPDPAASIAGDATAVTAASV